MYQDPAASHASGWGGGCGGLNNEQETGSAVGVVRVGPSSLSRPMAAQLLLSSICSLSGQFPQPQALSVLTTTHRSSELILLLWQHTGDLGHGSVFFFTAT